MSGKASHGHFLQRIESLRGIAALCVAVHHSFLFIRKTPGAEKINTGLIQAVFYGHGSVLCFFILSGLVLGESLRRLKPSGTSELGTFYTRRIFRIIPALIVSLAVCFLLLKYFSFWKSASPAATDYYLQFYNFSATTLVFLSNLFFLETTLNNVTWSLLPELLGSFLLPFFHFASKTWFWRVALLLGLILFQVTAFPVLGGLNIILQFMWMFYAGYLIVDLPPCFWNFFGRNPAATKFSLAIAAAVCLATPHFGHHSIPYVLAMGFIIAIIYGFPKEKLFGFLDNHATAFLGRISYSFYLFHFPVAYSVGGFLLNSLSSGFLIKHSLLMSLILTLASIGMAIPVSWCSYHYIEKPFIALGKKLAARRKVAATLN